MEERLPTALWVEAHVRQCVSQGVAIYVAKKGEYAGGLVLLKINSLDGFFRVLIQQRNIDGVLGWMDVHQGKPVQEEEADTYIERSMKRDDDLWVIEVEDKDGKNPFEGKEF